MARTQAAVVAGVGRCLIAHGARRTTMIDIAAASGIAKATLYNHVRTKGEAYALYADAELATLTTLVFRDPPQDGLRAAADAVAAHPVARKLAAEEPAAFAGLLTGPSATAGRSRLGEALFDRLGPTVGPVALRWLTSLLADPGTAVERAAGAALLVGAALEATAESAVQSAPLEVVSAGLRQSSPLPLGQPDQER